ncbi:MAG: AGE family epimerase/isomerase [Rhodanobacter sp.]
MRERGLIHDWLPPAAQRLFDSAPEHAWDTADGGIWPGFAPEGRVCDDDKYFCVQTESLVAAALLHERTGEHTYAVWYGRLWALRAGIFRRSPARARVPHQHPRQPQVRRREKSRRQDRLPHNGRLPRAACTRPPGRPAVIPTFEGTA